MALPHLLVVTPWYPNRLNSNDGNFVRNTTRLARGAYQITVLCVIADAQLKTGQPFTDRSLEDGILVIRSYYASAGGRVRRVWARRRAWMRGIGLLAGDYDLIHAHVLIDGGIVAARLARKFGVPFVVSAHASRWLRRWPAARLPERKLALAAVKGAAAILPVSHALATALGKYGLTDRIKLLSNPVEETIFYPPSTDRVDRPFTFLHVSDFTKNKRLDLIAEAFTAARRAFPDCQLVVAGDGSVAGVQALFSRGDGWRVLGARTPRQIADLMREADCFLLTSDVETQSIVLLEAQLSGLYAIATRSGGPDTILMSERAGQLIDCDSPPQLYEAMITALERGPLTLQDQQEIAALAKARYGAAAVRKQLLTIYQSALHA